MDAIVCATLHRRAVGLLGAVTFLASCGGQPVTSIAYPEPHSGPVARVRFVNYTNAVSSGLREYDESDCKRGEREVARFVNGRHPDPKRIGIPRTSPSAPEDRQTEIRVRGDAPFYGVYWSTAPTSSLRALFPVSPTTPLRCAVAFEFSPDAGRDYQLSFHSDIYRQSCIAILTTIDEHGALGASKDVGMPAGRCMRALMKMDAN